MRLASLAIAGVTWVAIAAPARAILFNVDISRPIDTSLTPTPTPGNITITGFIETNDGPNLTVADIIDYELTFSSPNYPSLSFDPTDTDVSLFPGARLVIDRSGPFPQLQAINDTGGDFFIEEPPSFIFPDRNVFYTLESAGPASPWTERIEYTLAGFPGQPRNVALTDLGSNVAVLGTSPNNVPFEFETGSAGAIAVAAFVARRVYKRRQRQRELDNLES